MLKLLLKICKWLVFVLETDGTPEENAENVSYFEEEVENKFLESTSAKSNG